MWLRGELRGSLPAVDGALTLDGLAAPVLVERDELGVPTISARSRLDVARATGFLHAQERFFQMDLQRRAAAGELAALLGPAVVGYDRGVRVHRFRASARDAVARFDSAERALLEAYVAGVNSGLAALASEPFEYLLLRATPEPWSVEDTLLVVYAMYLDLEDGTAGHESTLGLMHDLLPAELVEFLAPPGTEWDAPLVGEPPAAPPIPPADRVDLRRASGVPTPTAAESRPAAGSNAWAVAGSHTADGGALVADDMHLALRLPNIWYRASFIWSDKTDSEVRVTGVTLPGAPPIVAGSNGHVAWGFTNAELDLTDLVVLDEDPTHTGAYLTPDGQQEFTRYEERIRVKGAPDELLEVLWTRWGPVIDRDHLGHRRAVRWVAQDPDAVNLSLLRMEHARDVDEALDVASRAALPTQNCVVADRGGRIGWTLAGPIPRRRGLTGRWPTSWSDGSRGWDGWLAPSEHPRVVDPSSGRIWSANNRALSGAAAECLGDGSFDLGARATQIRDELLAHDRVTPEEMLAIQLDDRALLLARWRDLLLALLDEDAVAAVPRRGALRRVVERGWTGRASIDSAGYRLVRAFRLGVGERALGALTAPCRAADAGFSAFVTPQWEGPLWRLVTEQPAHLLGTNYRSWRELLLAAADWVLEQFPEKEASALEQRTWGGRNTVWIRHPLSAGLPSQLAFLSQWLDLPAEPLPGDANMPRVQSPGFGASERFVVSPGREEAGLYHMPGGQSGHPLSPYYRAGHDAWARGEARPFLPGPPVHRLTLQPPAS